MPDDDDEIECRGCGAWLDFERCPPLVGRVSCPVCGSMTMLDD